MVDLYDLSGKKQAITDSSITELSKMILTLHSELVRRIFDSNSEESQDALICLSSLDKEIVSNFSEVLIEYLEKPKSRSIQLPQFLDK